MICGGKDNIGIRIACNCTGKQPWCDPLLHNMMYGITRRKGWGCGEDEMCEEE